MAIQMRIEPAHITIEVSPESIRPPLRSRSYEPSKWIETAEVALPFVSTLAFLSCITSLIIAISAQGQSLNGYHTSDYLIPKALEGAKITAIVYASTIGAAAVATGAESIKAGLTFNAKEARNVIQKSYRKGILILTIILPIYLTFRALSCLGSCSDDDS